MLASLMNLIIPMLAGVVIDTVLQANAENMVRESKCSDREIRERFEREREI